MSKEILKIKKALSKLHIQNLSRELFLEQLKEKNPKLYKKYSKSTNFLDIASEVSLMPGISKGYYEFIVSLLKKRLIKLQVQILDPLVMRLPNFQVTLSE